MIYAAPNAPFEATAQWGTSGLVGTITVALYDGIGGTAISPHTTQIVETPTGLGIYTASMTAPAEPGQYTIVWVAGTDEAADDLLVNASIGVLPGPTTGMSLSIGELLDQILLDRFEYEHRPRALLALNNRYAHLWAIEDWTWRFVKAWLSTSAGNPVMSGYADDFGVPIYLWDDKGEELAYLDTEEFGNNYFSLTTPGRPECWTVIAQRIHLGPTPASNSTGYQTYYRRRLIPLSEETEIPEIPQEFQLALVHGARAELLAFYNDPTAGDMEQQWQMDIEALRREYLADATGQPSMWPSDMAGMYGRRY